MSQSPLSPPPVPPHLQINSGSQSIITPSPGEASPEPSRPSTAKSPDGRQLMSPGSGSNTPTLSKPPSLYSRGNRAGQSTELLLPPSRLRPRRFRDESDSPLPSPGFVSSRRNSFSSDSSRDSRFGMLISPFDDSRAPSRAGSDDGMAVNTQTVSEKFNIQPSAGLLLFPEDVEKDDWLHTPDPNDKDDRMQCDFMSRRGATNLGGLIFIAGGILLLFIGYPILTFVHHIEQPAHVNACAQDPNCIDVGPIPLLKNIRTGLIDPDTPSHAMSRTARDGSTQSLAFSDEFNVDGRTFYDGDDPYFQGVDLWYGATQDLEWYDPDALTTKDGTLNIQFSKYVNHGLSYQSGMLQSWNKLCFKGGTLEASISLPGRGDVSGFWPGFWAMGNLGRPGYMATSDGMWPYSYDDVCDAGITANQSQTDGTSYLPGMKLPACTCGGQDHPSPGKSRSAPEIDVLEAQVTPDAPGGPTGGASQSFQVAPFDIFYQPNLEFAEMYDYSITEINTYQGGPFQEAISAVTTLNNDWYNGNAYQSYSFEYAPGSDGYITWYVGKEKTWTLDGRALGPNGNVGQRVVPEEPMSIIINFGMSPTFAELEIAKLADLLPATMRIDYIRIYQDSDSSSITCDPDDYPTTEYIKKHPEPYNNPNMTEWKDTKYSWPTNNFANNC